MRVIVFLFVPIIFFHFQPGKNQTTRISGAAQGTTYHITYLSLSGMNYKREIDSILADLDTSLSTYIPESIISRINTNDRKVLVDHYFTDVFNKSMEVSRRTGGLFDVTVAPIVNAYGFGFTKKSSITDRVVDSLLDFVGYKKVKLQGRKLIKERPEIMLDFNAIAQGYSIDVLARFLDKKGITNYLVELGGEVIAKGKNENHEYWKVGIDRPAVVELNASQMEAIISLQNSALATSGNYKKFFMENGRRYAHIIDPHTGYPAEHNLISATVIAADCMTADAYATAFMVMGVAKTKQFLSQHKKLKLQVYLIYDENNVWRTFASDELRIE